MKLTLFFLLSLVCVSFCQLCPDLASVPQVDLNKYIGKWYEIATSRIVYSTFERNCVCVNANYTIESDQNGVYVGVRNSCRKNTPSGPEDIALGRADILDPSKPGELAVSFGPVPATSPNYIIMTLGDESNYGYALVGEPCRRALWILSRDPTNFPDDLYNYLLDFAAKNGYNPSAIGFRKTLQEGCY